MIEFVNIADNFPITFDVEKMVEELSRLESESWLEHYDVTLSRGWKSIPLVSKGGELSGPESQRGGDYSDMKRTRILKELPYFKEILDSFKCQHGRIRITRLDPGAGIDMHRDIRHEVANLSFNKVRLHIPIKTNPGVWFWVEGKKITMAPGGLYYVNFSKRHYVRNEGDDPRFHLVLDLEVNDWLLQFFPKLSLVNKFEMWWDRLYLPFTWKMLIVKTRIKSLVWEAYKSSYLRRLRHKYFPKN